MNDWLSVEEVWAGKLPAYKPTGGRLLFSRQAFARRWSQRGFTSFARAVRFRGRTYP